MKTSNANIGELPVPLFQFTVEVYNACGGVKQWAWLRVSHEDCMTGAQGTLGYNPSYAVNASRSVADFGCRMCAGDGKD